MAVRTQKLVKVSSGRVAEHELTITENLSAGDVAEILQLDSAQGIALTRRGPVLDSSARVFRLVKHGGRLYVRSRRQVEQLDLAFEPESHEECA